MYSSNMATVEHPRLHIVLGQRGRSAAIGPYLQPVLSVPLWICILVTLPSTVQFPPGNHQATIRQIPANHTQSTCNYPSLTHSHTANTLQSSPPSNHTATTQVRVITLQLPGQDNHSAATAQPQASDTQPHANYVRSTGIHQIITRHPPDKKDAALKEAPPALPLMPCC